MCNSKMLLYACFTAFCCKIWGMEVFALRLKELREDKKMTQKEVAQLLHITQQSYLRYELNTGEPSLETLVKLAGLFEVSADYLLGLADV